MTRHGHLGGRSYWENGQARLRCGSASAAAVSIPVGFTTFPDEIFRAPRAGSRRRTRTLVYFNAPDKGGHFAAWEQPQLLARRLRAAFRPLRSATRERCGRRRPTGTRIARLVHRLAGEAAACRSKGAWRPSTARTGWLNSGPLTRGSLRGRVVLVDFWTYTCINWLRTLPYVRAWADKYREHGLTVIGVHTPEFAFEQTSTTSRAVARLRGRVSGRARQRLRRLAGFEEPLLAGRLHRRCRGPHPLSPLRRG